MYKTVLHRSQIMRIVLIESPTPRPRVLGRETLPTPRSHCNRMKSPFAIALKFEGYFVSRKVTDVGLISISFFDTGWAIKPTSTPTISKVAILRLSFGLIFQNEHQKSRKQCTSSTTTPLSKSRRYCIGYLILRPRYSVAFDCLVACAQHSLQVF